MKSQAKSSLPQKLDNPRPASSVRRSAPWAIGAVMSASLGCAGGQHGSGHTHAEVSIETPESLPDDTDNAAGTEKKTDATSEVSASDGGSELKANASEIGAVDLNRFSEAPEIEVARTALHRIEGSDNHLGLVLAVGERTSDLAWVLAIENRSEQDVRLATLPSLVQFEIESQTTDSSDESAPAGKSILCGGSLPKTLSSKETKVLPAGGMLVHAFDPRTYCEAEDALVDGAVVSLTFGFPITRKKLWRQGKLTEVDVEQVSPFLAERVETGSEEVAGLKHIKAQPFTLGRTYPLSEVSARPAPTGDAESIVSATDVEAIPDPLKVSIYPLGSSDNPEKGLVRVRVQNVSRESVLLHLRREAFSYEVAGPSGTTTCRMMPDQLSATSLSYSSVAPGSSLTLSTRLAEACPPGVWDEPGRYSVAVRFAPTSSGEEQKEDAFVGIIEGSNVARLTVPGARDSQLPQMLVLAN